MENKLHWNLYSDKEQTRLLACAEDEEQIKIESQYYSGGYWFEYDESISERGTIFLNNERQYNKKVKFPKEPQKRPVLEDKNYDHIKGKDWF